MRCVSRAPLLGRHCPVLAILYKVLEPVCGFVQNILLRLGGKAFTIAPRIY